MNMEENNVVVVVDVDGKVDSHFSNGFFQPNVSIFPIVDGFVAMDESEIVAHLKSIDNF